jgi:hypothetical protein
MQQVSVLETNIGSSTTGNSANTQIIFNDNGTLRGDTGLVYNKTTDALTVAGLVTAGSATITGDLTVDTTTLVVDPTNDRVGIGTATPACKLEVVAPAGNNIVSTFRSGDATALNNAGGGFQSISSATAASRVARVWLDADGADLSGGDYFFIQKNGNSGTVEFNQSSNAAMTFLTNGTECARFNTAGNLAFVSGKGIDFSATAGTGTSELLADYEEGTWTGTVTGGTFTNLTTGRYTKIGRQVFASITPNTTAITGNLVISGLPFAAGARSAMVVTTAPPAGVTYIPRFVDATDIYVNVSGTYAGVSESTYFAFTYDV